MEELRLKALVESVVNFFRVHQHDDVVIGMPYLLEKEGPYRPDCLTGTISVHGTENGWLSYSAPLVMIRQLLKQLGETDTSAQNMKDMVGEVANVISGNMRKHFGPEFHISTPVVTKGVSVTSDSKRCYVVPLKWRQHDSSIVVYFREK